MAELYPKINKIEKPNAQTGSVIKGLDSYVSESAVNVYESGARNSVGDGCKNISILNSSGCTVTPYVTGSTIINSSGVIVTENNQTWINNQLSERRIKTTTNNSLTVLASIQLLTGAFLIDATIHGIRSDSAGQYAGKIFSAFRLESGVLVQINGGSVNLNSLSDGTIIDADASMQVSGSNAQIVITPANTTVNWVVNYTVQKL